MYLEMSLSKVRHIIRGRRLMFLHYILGRSESDLVQVYEAQKANPTKGDWYEVIKEDLSVTGLDKYDEEQIRKFSKDQWKNIVNTAIDNEAFQSLLSEAKEKTKTKELKYTKLGLQEYLKSDQIKFKNEAHITEAKA